jgi:hypothetical protein
MTSDEAWICSWLDDVASGKATMSQRAVSAIERRGGLDRVVAAARARGVHLVQLEDDKGKAVVAASLKPFRTLC